MALPSFTTKVAGSDNNSERKILTTDMNQIKQALQTGDLDIGPQNVLCQGSAVLLQNGSGGIRYNPTTNKTQYSHNGVTFTDMDSATSELITVTAGETIGTGKLIYLNTTDDKVYMTNTGTATTYDWLGMTSATVNTDATGNAYTSGNLVGGFAGFSPGDWYGMSSENGSIILNGNPKVGVAITANQIKLIKDAGVDSNFMLNATALVAAAASTAASDEDGYLPLTSSNLDYANSTCFCKGDIAFCDILDAFADGAINANIWAVAKTGGGNYGESSSGATGYIFVSSTNASTCTAIANNYTSTPNVDLKKNCEIIFNWWSQMTHNGGNNCQAAYAIYLTDGTNKVTLYSGSIGGAGTITRARATSRLVINQGTTTAYLYDSLTSTTPTTKNLSGLTGTRWFFEIEATGTNNDGSATANLNVYSLGYLNGNAGSSSFQTAYSTITSSNFAFMRANFALVGQTASNSISFDNGSNYVAASNRKSVKTSNAGTQLIFKTTVTHPTSLSVGATNRNIPSLTNVQIFYD